MCALLGTDSSLPIRNSYLLVSTIPLVIDMAYLSAIVARGTFLAPNSAHVRPFLKLVNRFPTSPPPIVRRPFAVRKRLDNARRTSSVFVSLALLPVQDVSQSHAFMNVSGAEGMAPRAGDIAESDRAISITKEDQRMLIQSTKFD